MRQSCTFFFFLRFFSSRMVNGAVLPISVHAAKRIKIKQQYPLYILPPTMQVKDTYNFQQLTNLKAQIQRIQHQIRTVTSVQSTTYYEDDNFAFQLDQNGHQIARIKASEKSKESSQLIEAQRYEIAALRKENERIKKEMHGLEVGHKNIKNKYEALMEYLKPHHLYAIFKKEFEENNDKSHDNKEIAYKIIEIPIEKEVIVEVPVETQRIIWRQIEKQVKVEVPIETVVEVPIEVERIIEIQRIVQMQKIVYIDRINEVIVERIKEVPVEVVKFIEVVKTVEVPLEIERTVEVEVERVVEKIVEVERIVQVEKIVEVQKIIEVEKIIQVEKIIEVEKIVEVERWVEVERVVEVEKIVEVPYEVIVERIIEKECPIEVIVQVEKIVQVPVEVEKIVYLELIHEVEKIVKTEWIDYAEQLNKERQELLTSLKCQGCNKNINNQDKLGTVQSQGESNWLLVEKEQEIDELKEDLEFIEEENKRLREEIDNYSSLYETQLKLNEQNSQKIIQLNKQILALGKPSSVNGTSSTLKDYKETPFPSSLTDSSSSRIKLLCNHSQKDVSDKLKKYISQIANKELADNIATTVHEISLQIESQQRLNSQLKETIAKLQGKSHQNQPESYNLAINNEITALKRQNYQLKLQLNNQQTSNQTQELIQNLTLQLQQEKNSKQELQQENQSLSLELSKIQSQLLQTTQALQSLTRPLNQRLNP